MHALTLRAEQAEELDGLGACAVEPVRNPGVELGRLARFQDQVVLAEICESGVGQQMILTEVVTVTGNMIGACDVVPGMLMVARPPSLAVTP